MARRSKPAPPPDDMGTNPPAGEVVKRKPGRKPGSSNAINAIVRKRAIESGKLPHEILLDIARGNPIDHHVWDPEKKAYVKRTIYPPWEDRVDAAKAAAPYFAPRLAAQVIKTPGTTDPSQLTDQQVKDELTKMLIEFGITDMELIDEDTLEGATLVKEVEPDDEP